MTSYCKKFIGFPPIILENPSFYRNKHKEIKREMTSSGETGGAASIHIILCGYNNKDKCFNEQNLDITCQR